MIICSIPGRGTLEINHLVFDVNGTLTLDGKLLPGIAEALEQLKDHVTIHLVTADTLGRLVDLEKTLASCVSRFHRLTPGSEAEQIIWEKGLEILRYRARLISGKIIYAKNRECANSLSCMIQRKGLERGAAKS